MKDTDKITLTVGQLKRLIKESSMKAYTKSEILYFLDYHFKQETGKGLTTDELEMVIKNANTYAGILKKMDGIVRVEDPIALEKGIKDVATDLIKTADEFGTIDERDIDELTKDYDTSADNGFVTNVMY